MIEHIQNNPDVFTPEIAHKEGYEKYVDYWNDKLKQQIGTFPLFN
jgi:hypothetical protein